MVVKRSETCFYFGVSTLSTRSNRFCLIEAKPIYIAWIDKAGFYRSAFATLWNAVITVSYTHLEGVALLLALGVADGELSASLSASVQPEKAAIDRHSANDNTMPFFNFFMFILLIVNLFDRETSSLFKTIS